MEIKLFSELSNKQIKYIAEENYHYWKKINPDLDFLQSTNNIIEMKSNSDVLPLGIAILENKNIVGFCTLRENRLRHHLDINPWLCNVLIFEKYRGCGYAKLMLNFAYEKFKNLGYKKFFVWTDQAPDFYTKQGFKFEGKIVKNEGGEGLLFSKEI